MEFLTTAKAAEILNVTPGRVRAMILSGRLLAVKIGRDWMIPEENLALVADRKPGWKKGRSRK